MSDDLLRAKLADLLRGGDAARPTADILRDFPYDEAGVVLDRLPYSAWSLLEHLRISQEDIVEFSRGPGHESPVWPDEYWPDGTRPADEAAWNASIETLESDLEAMIELVEDEGRDLLVPFPWGDGQNLLREAIVLAEHNSYHSGQIVVIARLLGVWS